MIVLDFETRPITSSEPYPEPVGVALGDARSQRYVRGSLSDLRRAVLDAIAGETEIVMHNGVGFDMGVAFKHLDVDLRECIDHVHDTLVLAFLDDPYRRLGLKPLAAALLGMPAEEQADLKAWILANVPEARRAPQQWGTYIAKAPPELVEPYAKGDVKRTAKLFRLLAKNVRLDGMWDAYRREIAAVPILIENEMCGICCDLDGLVADLGTFGDRLERTDRAIRRAFKSPNLDIDSAVDVAARLEAFGIVLPKTEKGNVKTDVATLAHALGDEHARLRSLLLYRSALAQDVRTFLRPWREQAERDGRLRTHWNLVGGSGRYGGGTRTGRLSSEPNLQNITSTEKREALVGRLGRGDWPLPRMRSYIVPERDGVLVGRDFSQQELRLLAHFENSDILEMYRMHPELDLHDYVGQMIQGVTGVALPRKTIKVLNFCTIYGGGAPAIARQGGMTVAEATEARDLYFAAMPTIRATMRETQRTGKAEGIRTIGGRVYEAEKGVGDDGRPRDFAYRLLNYRIQGSAADQMKEVLGELWRQRDALDAVFFLTVHDELLFSAPKGAACDVLKRLDAIMCGTVETFGLKVPFRSDGYMGDNWADVKKEKGL